MKYGTLIAFAAVAGNLFFAGVSMGDSASVNKTAKANSSGLESVQAPAVVVPDTARKSNNPAIAKATAAQRADTDESKEIVPKKEARKAPEDTLKKQRSAAPSSRPSAGPAKAALKLPLFTLKELAKYNGLNGNPAYIAIDSLIYDVTDEKAWAGGKHHGNTAGTDLTAVIEKSPHGKSGLRKRKVVGKLANEIDKVTK